MRIVTWNINGLGSLRFPFNLHAHHTHAYPPATPPASQTSSISSPSSSPPPASSSPPHPLSPDDFDYDDTHPSSHDRSSATSTSPTPPNAASLLDGLDGSEATLSPSSPSFPAFPPSRLLLPPAPITDYSSLLDYFQADIICMQEVKIGRARLDLLARAAFVAGYDSFFSFCRKRQGYSGVVTYTRTRTACPVAAEEGVSGTLPPIASTFPSSSTSSPLPSSLSSPIGHNSAVVSSCSANDLRELDSEGRCVITDHGAFLLFNLYVPNAGDDRNDFKLRYLSLLQLRLRECITAGRHVVVVGDLNIAASQLDHCRPDVVTLDDGTKVPFDDSPSRVWWRTNVSSDASQCSADPAVLVDVLRSLHPTQRRAYTCWNTLTGARAGNYGARIDYVLTSQSLMPALQDCRVLSYVEGSDHCPVQCDLDVTRLEGWKCGEVAPAHASQWWAEFSGQQKKLSQFFVKKPTDVKAGDAVVLVSGDAAQEVVEVDSADVSEARLSVMDRKRAADATFRATARAPPAKKKKVGGAQSGPSLLSYFGGGGSPNKATASSRSALPSSPPPPPPQPGRRTTPPSTPAPSSAAQAADSNGDSAVGPITVPPSSPPPATPPSPSPRHVPSSLSPSHLKQASPSSSDFTRLFTQSSLTLLCDHQLPAKLWTVNKKGPNHNRQFFCCAVPPPERCGFWKWHSDAKKEAAAARARTQREERGDRRRHELDGGEEENEMARGFVAASSLHSSPKAVIS